MAAARTAAKAAARSRANAARRRRMLRGVQLLQHRGRLLRRLMNQGRLHQRWAALAAAVLRQTDILEMEKAAAVPRPKFVPMPKFFQPQAGTKHMLQVWYILMYWENCYTRATGMHWRYWAHFMVTVVRKWQWESLDDEEKVLAVCREVEVYSGNSQATRSRPLCSYTEEKASPCTEIG